MKANQQAWRESRQNWRRAGKVRGKGQSTKHKCQEAVHEQSYLTLLGSLGYSSRFTGKSACTDGMQPLPSACIHYMMRPPFET